MVTMVLYPENSKSTHKLVHVENSKLLLTTLEPYTTTALIELARAEDIAVQRLPRQRKILVSQQPREKKIAVAGTVDVKPAGSCTMNGSVCIFGSITTWTLLVCLFLARSRKAGSHYGHEVEHVVADLGCQPHIACDDDCVLLSSLSLDGALTFSNMTSSSAGFDFGLIRFSTPRAVVYPKSVRDVRATVRAVRSSSQLTLAAKGRGHSVHGQAQVRNFCCHESIFS